jgi:hypothetical protein
MTSDNQYGPANHGLQWQLHLPWIAHVLLDGCLIVEQSREAWLT